jgi:hypothetical protein
MTLDARITEAIQATVDEAGQSPALARRLIAWMEGAASGNEDLNDLAASARHLELLYAETTVSSVRGGQSDDVGG